MGLGSIFGFRKMADFDTGMNYMVSGQLKKAVKEFDRLIVQNPEDTESIYVKGECLTDLGQFDKALECFNQSLSLNEDNTLPLLGKGRVLIAMERDQEALDIYKIFIKKNWKQSKLQGKIHDAFCARAFIFMKQRRLDVALKEYQNALSIDPRNDLALANVGSICLEKVLGGAEDYQTLQTEAGKLFFEALRLNPNNATANYGLGYIMHALSKPQEAIAYLEKVPEDNSIYNEAQLLKEDCVEQVQLRS